jgi:hypothetical protein
MASQLTVLVPTKTFKTSVGDVKIGPIKILTDEGAEAIAIIDRYFKVLGDETANQDNFALLSAILGCGESKAAIAGDMLHILHVCSGVEKEKLQELGHDEVLSLMAEVLKQNMDFFPKLMAIVQPKKEEVKAETPKTGVLESAD